MPNKRGSRVAASRAKAQERAKKKARGSGTVVQASQGTSPGPVDTIGDPDPAGDPTVLATAVPNLKSSTEVPDKAPIASRRDRQSAALVAGASLRRELGTIGVLSAAIGILLVALKFGTDLGA